jgi:acetyl esterase/lipase
VKSWTVVVGLLVAVALGVAIGARLRVAPVHVERSEAEVFYRVITRETLRVDLYVPKTGEQPSPWLVFVHERGWPAPDEKEREGAGIAVALQQRGIAVAVMSFTVKEGAPPRRSGEEIVEAIRELQARADQLGLGSSRPVLAGAEAGAALVASLALDTSYGVLPPMVRGVIGMNGIYDGAGEGTAPADSDCPLKHVRADAPPFVVLSAHGDSKRSAQSSRAFARALERAGAKEVRAYHAPLRDAHTLGNLSGDKNDVGDLVAGYVKGVPRPAGGEDAFALSDTWSARAPLSTEPFWSDERLVVRRPTDPRFRARLRNLYGEMINDLDPWPLLTYAAIDLGDYLRAHPELGTGEWLEVTNTRGEKLVLSRGEIEQKKPAIVVGIDDEKNLFRLFVTYNVHRTYSWKPETEPRALLVRSVGAFLYLPAETEIARPDGTLHPLTGAEFALTTSSFKVVAKDPLAAARRAAKPVSLALTNEQGCLQCHALRGEGARAHHVRASDGKLSEGFGLALQEYPPDVMQRFLFEQQAVAKSFGVGPLELSEATAKQLLAEIRR